MSQEDMTDNLNVSNNTPENPDLSGSIDDVSDMDEQRDFSSESYGESLRKLQSRQKRNTLCTAVLAVLLFGFAGYELTRPEVEIPQQVDYSADINTVNGSIRALESSVKGIEGNVASKLDASALNAVNSKITGLSSNYDAMQSEVARINAKLGEEKTTSLSWAVFDAKYLLTLANRKVVIDRDYATAISLLKEADTVIAGVNDPRTRKLREAIASDLNALGNIPAIDYEKPLLRINELISNVSKMKIKGLKKVNLVEEGTVSENVDDWWDNLKTSMGSFVNSFVVIKRKDATDTALMAPDNEAFLRANLENYLLLAAKACFYREQELYSQYLNRARELTETYFDETDPVVQNTLKGINETAAEKIASTDVRFLNSTVEIGKFINEFAGK
ncbi:MAG: uroporphyrinogen-III C-methyltransferase [Ruminobacter sp.]|uniref:uroporphyrinogen-III C-methyltransferase n=1 Tax=Ruminobacter sp. TaxID=2774296 RepID=UPI001B65531A|nr:uroporphyrinogen-III C-methyltransferase [Ruminobacter sp.]MBP3749639.1 uroporphyrinogen-III C-methyltransferase [Ruminobacter sp.]